MQKVIVFAQEEPPAASLNEALRMFGWEMLPAHSEAQFMEAVDQCSPECMVVLSSATVDEDAMRKEVELRDRVDSNRPIAPLKPAPDAIIIDTDHLELDEVVERIASRVRPGA